MRVAKYYNDYMYLNLKNRFGTVFIHADTA